MELPERVIRHYRYLSVVRAKGMCGVSERENEGCVQFDKCQVLCKIVDMFILFVLWMTVSNTVSKKRILLLVYL